MWRPIKGYEGRYEISEDGQVKSLPKIKGFYIRGELILKTSLDKNGYVRVTLSDENGKSKTKKVHRLVAEAYIPNPNNLPEVNHCNGIKTDNSVNNLEWTTNVDNIRHAIKSGLRDYHYQSKKVVITDKETGETNTFQSMKSASNWLGHKRSYLAKMQLRRKTNEFEVGKYVIRIA